MANGFAKIGFISNLTTYKFDIKQLSGQFIDDGFVDATVDNQWQNRYETMICLTAGLQDTSPSANNIRYLLVDTGYTEKDSKEPIYGGLYSAIGDTDLSDSNYKWKGLSIGTKRQLLKLWGQESKGISDAIRIYDWEDISRVMNRLVPDHTATNWKTHISDTYTGAVEKDEFFVLRPEKASPIAYFHLNVQDKNNQELWAYTVENKNAAHPQDWFGLYIITRSDLVTFIYRKHFFFLGETNIAFSSPTDLNEFIKSLKTKAMPENWDWSVKGANSSGDNGEAPILKNYVEHTYYKLCTEAEEQEQDKIIEYKDQVYFNSGLLDRRFNQIILVGDKEELELDVPGIGVIRKEVLCNLAAYAHTEREIARNFRENDLPKIASYFTDRNQIIFDASLDIHLNEMHIYEDGVRRGRLPKYHEEYERLKDNPMEKDLLIARIDRDFKSARDRAKLMAERNYKLAVPQYWREKGKIQFLLPIYLGEREEAENPQCALALDFDDSGRIPYYRGATILTLDMAYNNARLIAKPDVFWLNSTVGD